MTPELAGPANAELIRTLSVVLPVISLSLAVLIGWRKYVSRDEGALKETVEKFKLFLWGDKVLQEPAPIVEDSTVAEAPTAPTTPAWLNLDIYGPGPSPQD